MKKVLLVLFVAVLAVATLNAQETKFGVKAGIVLPMFSGDNAEGVDGKMGFLFGGYANLGLSEQIAVQPEVLLVMAGSKFDMMGVELETDMTYIEIPVMLKYYVSEGFNLEAGPRIGLLMKAETEGVDVKDDFKSTNFGLSLGAGYEMENGLNFGARYTLGLANILDADDTDFKVGGLEFAVGFSF